VVVSDIKEEKDIEEAISLSTSGVLVLVTFRISGVVPTLSHMVDVFPEDKRDKIRAQLSTCLQGAFSQTLVARAKARGRMLCMEYMTPTAKIKRNMRDGEWQALAKLMEKEQDSKTQALALKDLFVKKTITREDALANAYDPSELERIIDRAY